MDGGEPCKLSNEATVLSLLFNGSGDNAKENDPSVKKKKGHHKGMATKSGMDVCKRDAHTARVRDSIQAQHLVQEEEDGGKEWNGLGLQPFLSCSHSLGLYHWPPLLLLDRWLASRLLEYACPRQRRNNGRADPSAVLSGCTHGQRFEGILTDLWDLVRRRRRCIPCQC